MAKPFAETAHELTRRGEIGKRQRLRRCAEHGIFDRADQQGSRRSRWYHDHSIAGIDRRTQRRETDHRLTKGLKVGYADETRAARSGVLIHSLQATSYGAVTAESELLRETRRRQEIREVLLHARQHHERAGGR